MRKGLVISLKLIILFLVGLDQIFCGFESIVPDSTLTLEVLDVFAIG